MIHNGIEYGLMQAYAEGFSILQHKTEFKLDLHQIAEIWRYGSVVRSWLLDLTANALDKEIPTLHGIAPYVADSARGAGQWPRLSNWACLRSSHCAVIAKDDCVREMPNHFPTSWSRPCAINSAGTPSKKNRHARRARSPHELSARSQIPLHTWDMVYICGAAAAAHAA